MNKHGDSRDVRQHHTSAAPALFTVTPSGKTVTWVEPEMLRPASEKYCELDGWQNVAGSLAEILGCPKCGKEWK